MDVRVDASIAAYIVDIVRSTREDQRVALGASPRGSFALLRLARAEAVLRRSDFVTPDDVKAMVVPALAHRIILRPELWVLYQPALSLTHPVADARDGYALILRAVPLAALLLSLSRSDETAELAITQHVSSDRLSEGDRPTIAVVASASAPIPVAELLVELGPGPSLLFLPDISGFMRRFRA